MKKRSWNLSKPMSAVVLTVAVLAVYQFALGAKTEKWTPPLTVDNPFAAPEQSPLVVPNPWVRSGAANFVGGPVDVELPPIYRLPRTDGDRLQREIVAPPRQTVRQPVAAPRMVAPTEDILPIQEDPTDDMLQAMEDLWQEPAFEESAPTANEPSYSARAPQYSPPSATPSFDEPVYEFDAAAAFPYTPTATELSRQLLPAVRKGFGLAQRGATYAAETEFILVLRRIAQAKDAEQGTDEHSRSLAAGLRALDEADDFAPDGVELEAEMNVAVIASSHRTPVVDGRAAFVLPHEAIALYHQYAEVELGRATAGERAGAMALYGIGKVHNRIALDSNGSEKHERKAMTMFLASLATAPENHLAANEVGVLLARGGHHGEAAAMFKRAIDVEPSSTNYHNLAMVEAKLGRHVQAAADERYAQQLAARDRATGAVSRRQGVTWVSPDQLARVPQPLPLPPAQVHGHLAGQMQNAAAPLAARPAPPKSPWQKTVELAKSLPLPGKSAPENEPVRVAQPMRTAAPQWH